MLASKYDLLPNMRRKFCLCETPHFWIFAEAERCFSLSKMGSNIAYEKECK
jgi:hypothetical protein